MIHIFDTSDHEEIRKIKAGYFDKDGDRHMVPILENPDEGLDPGVGNDPFGKLIDKLERIRGRDAGTRLRHVWSM